MLGCDGYVLWSGTRILSVRGREGGGFGALDVL